MNAEQILSIIKTSEGCVFWPYCKFKTGYGNVRFNGKKMRAHRVVYLLTKGDIPDGLFVCHKCDNKDCINPDHLFLGTNSENILDASSKGRTRRSKLSEDDVSVIRKITASRLMKQDDVVDMFKCSKATIWRVCNNLNYPVRKEIK